MYFHIQGIIAVQRYMSGSLYLVQAMYFEITAISSYMQHNIQLSVDFLRLLMCFLRLYEFFFSGVDFQMKRLIVDGEPTVLQLWDTAGQERLVTACNLSHFSVSFFF